MALRPCANRRNLIAVLTNRELISAFLGAVFAFVLAVAWDVIKDNRREVREERRALQLLRSEVAANIALLELIQEQLSKDSALAKENKELASPLPLLSTRSWESVHLAGALSDDRQQLAQELRETYLAVTIVNQRIQARETYRAMNQAMSNYGERRQVLNQILLESVQNVLDRFRTHMKQVGP
jgi:hypothetical protein